MFWFAGIIPFYGHPGMRFNSCPTCNCVILSHLRNWNNINFIIIFWGNILHTCWLVQHRCSPDSFTMISTGLIVITLAGPRKAPWLWQDAAGWGTQPVIHIPWYPSLWFLVPTWNRINDWGHLSFYLKVSEQNSPNMYGGTIDSLGL